MPAYITRTKPFPNTTKPTTQTSKRVFFQRERPVTAGTGVKSARVTVGTRVKSARVTVGTRVKSALSSSSRNKQTRLCHPVPCGDSFMSRFARQRTAPVPHRAWAVPGLAVPTRPLLGPHSRRSAGREGLHGHIREPGGATRLAQWHVSAGHRHAGRATDRPGGHFVSPDKGREEDNGIWLLLVYGWRADVQLVVLSSIHH